jgi:isopentenyldiphosphate isomerase
MTSLYQFSEEDISLLAFNKKGYLNLETILEPNFSDQFEDLATLNKLLKFSKLEEFKKNLEDVRLTLQYSLNEFNNYRPTPRGIFVKANRIEITFEITDYAQTKIVQDLWGNYYKNNRDKVLTYDYNELPFLSKSFGANLLIMTADDKILITKRSPRTRTYPSKLHVSTSEGSSLLDTYSNTIDISNIFIRSAREEIGIEIAKEDIEINALYLQLNRYQHGLSGYVNLSKQGITSEEILELHAKAVDSWEHEEIIFFHVSEIEKLLNQENKFVSFGYLTLILNLHNISRELVHLQKDLLESHKIKPYQ